MENNFMKITFADRINCDYTLDTLYEKLLGFSQSALCYLPAELATQGHEVFLLNNTKSPGIYRGVTCLSVPLTNRQEAKRRELDAFVVLNLTGYGAIIRSHIGKCTKLILWTGHTHHNRDMQALRNPEECKVYDGFAFVSEG